MSSLPNDPDRDDLRDDALVEDDAPRREASMRLEVTGAAGEEAALREAMDPANQSLADALRLSFRILQVAILALLVTFVFSGFQTVQDGYTGVKTVFGSIQGQGADAQLSPGLAPFWPYPIGEIIVFESKRSTQLRREFWPRIPPGRTVQQQIDSADTSNPIRPGPDGDGSVLTGDGDLAHLQVSAEWVIDDVASFVENIDRTDANEVVRKALMRGVVIASATTPLNELLADREMTRRAPGDTAESGAAAGSTTAPPASGDEMPPTQPEAGAETPAGAAEGASSDGASAEDAEAQALTDRAVAQFGRRNELEQLIREKAQAVLDGLNCGIRLVSVTVPERLAPLAIENRFAQLQAARETAKETVEKARHEARSRLVGSAGPAYTEILEGIRRYEAALLVNDDAAADNQLKALGARLEAADIGGEAALIINRARAYQGAIQATLGAEAQRVDGLADTFRKNPSQLVHQMRLDTIRQIFNSSSDQIEVLSMPLGVRGVTISSAGSPDVMQARREAELARKKAAADAQALLEPTWQIGLRAITPDRAGRKLTRDASGGMGR